MSPACYLFVTRGVKCVITKVSFLDKCLNMNRAQKRRQRKLAQKSSKASENAKATSSSFKQSTFNIQEALNTAFQFHVEGHHQEAKRIYREILDADPAHPIALQLLGVIAVQTGENEIAVELISKALAIYPEYVDAHNNIGNAFRNLNKFDEAVEHYKKAINLKPDHLDANLSLGAVLTNLGQFDEAVQIYHNVLTIKPDFIGARYNLGIVFEKQGNLDEAVTAYEQILAINPDNAKTHNNLGTVFKEQWKLPEAVTYFQRAHDLTPNQVEPLYNLGAALQQMGELDLAMESYLKVFSLQSDFAPAWINYGATVKANRFLRVEEGGTNVDYNFQLNPAVRSTPEFAMFEYFLDQFKPHRADESFRKFTASLPAKINEEISINGKDRRTVHSSQLPSKMVALLQYGRSGTGLLHSLIDGHPEISTLPSIYLRGYFNADVWNNISAEGWQKLPERFADEFAVLFDANSPKSTPGFFQEDSLFLGKKDGMTTVGVDRNESLSLDRDKFCVEVSRLMEGLDKIDPSSFFLIVHAAFEKITESKTRKHTIFYHLHDPGDYAKINFLRYFPNTKLAVMVREPVQSCESYIRPFFENNDYSRIVALIVSMFNTLDQVAFRKHDSVGIRLEDLKLEPKKTMQCLCDWLEIEEAPSLYQMTAQGKKWWGDPTSQDYDEKDTMSPFGTSSIDREIGVVSVKGISLFCGHFFIRSV